MDQNLYSSTLEAFDGNIENPALQDSLDAIFGRFPEMEPKLVKWSDSRIGLKLAVPVELPPHGNHASLDIQSTEPVTIVFNLEHYPEVPPIVFTDRMDFPKDNLAHLYISNNSKPPAFCLVKGSIKDWYSNKRSVDLVIRISNWLRDAATGELSENGDQFDPLRLEGYSGTMVYDYDMLYQAVRSRAGFLDSNLAILVFERKENSSYILKTFFTAENFEAEYQLLKEAFQKEEQKLPTPHYHLGYLIAAEGEQTYAEYNIEKPQTLSALEVYCAKFGVNLQPLKAFVSKNDFSHFRGIPLIVAIKRPKKVIGFNGDIEFANFTMIVSSDEKKEGTLDGNLPVSLNAHNQPLTRQKAKLISGNDACFDGVNFVFGLGALGSKIIMHLCRSGYTDFVLHDPDTISPHNLVRHAATAADIGKSKVMAIKESVDQIFSTETSLTYARKVSSDPRLKSKFLNLGNWIFDFTASEQFFNTLVNADNIVDPKVVRGTISDFGNLGILLIEGKNRKVRIDDMINTLYHRSGSSEWIKQWLQRELEANDNSNLLVNVGVGCNSETTILADDKVSIHAAYFTGILKRESRKQVFEGGRIYLNRIVEDDEYQVMSEVITVEEFEVFQASNDRSWQVRYAGKILPRMKELMVSASPFETGGVFIGSINYKTKTIHVLDLIDAPDDSDANEVCFHRGINGLPERVDDANISSGNQLGYVGEWHSHPNGPDMMSLKDTNTVRRFKSELSELTTPLPVFLTIITPNQILPYVF